MSELVILKDRRAVTTSLQVAETFGKQHKDVLEAYDNLIAQGVAENSADLFFEDEYTHPQNKQNYRLIIMNRDGFTLLAMGFTGKQALQFKLKYIEAFNKMDDAIRSQIIPLTAREQALLALAANEETNERVDLIEKDIKHIKENSLISTEDKSSLDRLIRNKVYAYVNDHRLNKEAKSMLFQDLGKSLKELFNVPHRGRIKEKDFQSAIDFIGTWEPTSVTKAKIKQLNLFKVA